MMEYAIIGLVLAPIWIPLFRFATLLRANEKHWGRSRDWAFAFTFFWTGGLVLLFWASEVPSGIPYGMVILIGWVLLLVSIALDATTVDEIQPPEDQ